MLFLAAGVMTLCRLATSAGARQMRNLTVGRFIRARSPSIPQHHRLYAVDQDGNRVIVVDRMAARSSIAVGQAPNCLVVDRRLNRIYVANAGSGNISVIDGTTDHVVKTLPGEKHPYAIGFDSALHRAYVTNTYSNKVTVIDTPPTALSSCRWAPRIMLRQTHTAGGHSSSATKTRPSPCWMLRMRSVTKILASRTHGDSQSMKQRGIVYVTEIGKNMLIAYHEESGKTDAVPTGAMPDAVAIDEAANRIYVANYVGDSVTVIDGATMKPVATVAAGHHPQALAVDGKRHRIFVANTHSNNVTVIDGATNRVLGTLPGGDESLCSCCRSRKRRRLRRELRFAPGHEAGSIVTPLMARRLTVASADAPWSGPSQ